MLTDLQNGLFSELKSQQTIDANRRLLQKSYARKLISILNPTPITVGNDIQAIARLKLLQLKNQITAALPITTETFSKIHLQDLHEKIKQALEPK
jgi:hypothetical protein